MDIRKYHTGAPRLETASLNPSPPDTGTAGKGLVYRTARVGIGTDSAGVLAGIGWCCPEKRIETLILHSDMPYRWS